MLIRVYNRDLELLGVVDKIQCLIWSRRYWTCGDFSLLLPAEKDLIELMKKGNLIIPDGKNEAAEIRYIDITRAADGTEQIEVQGHFISGWIGKRIVKRRIIATDDPANLILRIVRENVTEPEDESRKIHQLTAMGDVEQAALAEYASEPYANALDEIEVISGAGEVGFYVHTDAVAKTNEFRVYRGRDLSAGNDQGNNPCIFSRENDNVISQHYIESSEDRRNVAYVVSDDEDVVTTLIVGSASGLDRDELYVEAGDIRRTYTDDSGEEITIGEAEYLDLLAQRGRQELSEYIDVIEFDSRINPNANLIYREDFDVGDIVTCKDRKWGLEIDARITEVTETYRPGRYDVSVVFGEPSPTLADKLKRMER